MSDSNSFQADSSISNASQEKFNAQLKLKKSSTLGGMTRQTTLKQDNIDDMLQQQQIKGNALNLIKQKISELFLKKATDQKVENIVKKKNSQLQQQKIKALKYGEGVNELDSNEFTESEDDGGKKEKYNYYNDSDLESQMDDFKITEKSIDPSDHENSDQSENDCESDQIHDDDQEFPDGVSKVCKHMENYYNKNYKTYNVNSIRNIYQEKVWNIQYDDTYDFVYIMLAKINQLKGYEMVKGGKVNHESREFTRDFTDENQNFEDFSEKKYFDKSKQKKTYKDFVDDKLNIKIFSDCTVDFELTLQVWNCESRILRDSAHLQHPVCTYQVMKRQVHIPGKMSTFSQMSYIQNLFQSRAEIVQNHELLHIYRDFDKIFTLDVISKQSQTQKLKTQDDFYENIKCSQTHLHWKDLGKRNQILESIYTFFYIQEEDITATQSYGASMIDVTQANSGRKYKKQKQKIILRTINYVDLKSKFETPEELPRNKNIKAKDHSFVIKDDKIAEYYLNNQKRSLKSMFIQRIADSTSYFILFPTGLIMLVSSNPLALQSKLQLNLKKDEMIVDFSYCISSNRKNQCIWLLDEKQQVWKCFNELSSNSCNWVIQKINVFENLSHKKFLEPAMNYESYTLTQLMFKMKCFNEIGKNDDGTFEFLYGYNGTSTNTIVVKQPKMMRTLENTKTDEAKKSLLTILNSKIEIYAVTKNQNIICNKIPLKNTYFNIQKTQQCNSEPDITQYQVNNEVQELIYLGLSQQTDAKKKQFRKFMVRRQRSLEIMYTNGLYFWSELVPNSQINHPMEIQDIILSKNFQHLLVYYSPQGFPQQVQIKTFVQNEQENFDDYEHNQLLGVKSQKNITLDQNGQLFCIRVEKFRSAKSSKVIKNIFVDKSGQELTIRIPEILLNKELFEPQNYLERMIQSDDGKILMCGKLILRLNDVQDDLDQIGCIMLVKDHNKIKYKFLSLFESDDQRIIELVLKQSPENIVSFSFDSLPVYQDDNSDIMYVQNCIDEMTGETSILKIHTDTFICYEIYYSRFRIVHMSTQAVMESKHTSSFLKHRSATVVEKSQIFSESDDRNKIKTRGKNEKRRLKQRQSHLEQLKQFKEDIQPRKTKKYLISLVSQSKTHVNIEVIKDQNHVVTQTDNSEEHNKSQEEVPEKTFLNILRKTLKTKPNIEESDDGSNPKYAHLDFFVNVSVKKELLNSSEIVWINNNQLILTLNNDFYIVNLKHNDLRKIKGGAYLYGVHNVNMNIFCSIIKRKICHVTGLVSCREEYIGKKASLALIESQQSIQRMEIASLRRYSLIQQSKKSDDIKNLLFFTPSEELDGGNIFSQLSNNYSVMQPYLEKIDAEFIALMNNTVQNIAMYVKPNLIIINNRRVMSDIFQDESQNTNPKTKNYQFQKLLDNTESFQVNSGKVHMYQKDISGQNAIDYAFNKNAIFCIKAFVETLLILTDDVSFQNCFDKALLMMISRGMDVKELVSSELFYVSVWKDVPIFSNKQEVTISPYNGEIEDLEFEDPKELFEAQDRVHWLKSLFNFQDSESSDKEEEFEMQFNYILMEDIQGENKLSLTKVLKECNDLELFEEEAIQNIIDFKWNTYGYKYYLNKFMLYSIFLVLYYVDLESLPVDKADPRIKDLQFYVLKSICGLIMFLFAIFEMMQLNNEGQEYFLDAWNYFEILGILLYYYAATLDIINTHTTTLMRILFSCSILMSLVKIVYLVRVFKQLNFLVTMLITVVNEIVFFFVLFSIFLLTFAECFNLLEVDMGTYGRMPKLMSHIISTLRISMGDFALIDAFQTFDLYELEVDEFGNDVKKYRLPYNQLWATWSMWVIAIMFLFMIFMNFIIAVIGDSFNKVLEYKTAHDYQQRLMMLYEREVQFTQKDFDNNEFFPQVIIVRKLKENSQIKQSWSNYVTVIKNFIKIQNSKMTELFQSKSKDQKQHLTNSLKVFETDINNMYKEVDKIYAEVRKISNSLKEKQTVSQKRRSTFQKNMRAMESRESSNSSSDTSMDGTEQGTHQSSRINQNSHLRLNVSRLEKRNSEKHATDNAIAVQLQQMNSMIDSRFEQMNQKIEQLTQENQSLRQQMKPEHLLELPMSTQKRQQDAQEEEKEDNIHDNILNFFDEADNVSDVQIDSKEENKAEESSSKKFKDRKAGNIKFSKSPPKFDADIEEDMQIMSAGRPNTQILVNKNEMERRHEVSPKSQDRIQDSQLVKVQRESIAWKSESKASKNSKSETPRDSNPRDQIPNAQITSANKTTFNEDSIHFRNHQSPNTNSLRSSQQIKQSIISTRRMQRQEQIKQYELKLQQLKNMDDSDDLFDKELESHKIKPSQKKRVVFDKQNENVQQQKHISFVSDGNKSNEEQTEEDQQIQIISSPQQRKSKGTRKQNQVKY